MLLNIGTLQAAEGNLSGASEFTDLAERLLTEASEPLPHQEVSVRGLRGYIAALDGRPLDALKLYRQAWRRSRKLHDREMSCVCGQNIGSAYADLKRPRMAAQWYRHALSIAEETGNIWRQKELQRALAVVAHRMGDSLGALVHFESARSLASRTDDRRLVGTLTADIGAILAFTGDPRGAGELDQAARLLTEFEDAADWLYRIDLNRGELARRSGDRPGAAALLRQALGYAGSDDNRRAVHERLALLYLEEPPDEAAAFEEFSLAADCATKAGPADKAWLLGPFATYLSRAGCLSAAIKMFDLAISMGEFAGDAEVLFHLRNNRSLVLVDLGDLTAARDEFQAGVKWAQAARNRVLEVQAHHNLGETQRRLGDLAGSRESLRRALELSEELGDNDAWRSALALLAITALAEGSLDEAEQYATKTRDASRSVLDKANEASATGTLAGVEFARGSYNAAADTYRTASRLNRDEPIHHLEDLMGMLEASAAADAWRRTRRAAQKVVDYAQQKSLQHAAWPSLLRAARRYLDRGRSRDAAVLAALALVLAHESRVSPQDSLAEIAAMGERDSEIALELGQIIRVLVTLAFFVKFSSQDSAGDLWEFLLEQIADSSDQTRDVFRHLISAAQDAVAKDDPGEQLSPA